MNSIKFLLAVLVALLATVVPAQAQNEKHPDAPKKISWDTRGDDWRNFKGERFKLLCPSGGDISGQLWGTEIYADDSSVCTAAVHSGLISVSEGGVVTLEVLPGQERYVGSKRNGIESMEYASWPGSFRLVANKGAETTNTTRNPSDAAAREEGPVTDITWSTAAQKFAGGIGTRLKVRCPGNGDARHRVWGTDIYTDDSSICVAAVHSGLMKVEGGIVTIEIRAGQNRYQGTRRNNVITEEYGSWTRSFAFVVEARK